MMNQIRMIKPITVGCHSPHGNINSIKGRRYIRFLNGSLSFFIESSKPSDPVGVIGIPQASSAQYMKLMPDGHLKVFEWKLEEWKLIKDLTTVFQSYADLSTTWRNNYSVVQPILLGEMNGAQYACGFLCEGNCADDSKSFHYIFAIFISSAPLSTQQK
ncbi:hypothetical protein HanPSC8_Chr13g0546271 [Helianthus annuus]|nr:hypothetical protein HanPSC8_Chr13g0546271 [Helianthus annuus]